MITLPLKIEHLCKRYGGTAAVCGLDLALEPGEILTVLGPSGCGKTTTLRLVAGFECPDGGAIVIAGRQAAGCGKWIPPEERGVGMVFQDYALFPHLTVSQNVGFGLHRLRGKQRRERVAQLLELTGLEGLASRYPYHLSGGQQQRVALARALAPAPALVLLDEPFSSLDAALRGQMRDDVRRILKETGAAAIFVTHDQRDALAISDRVAVMNAGRVEQIGTPREIYQSPRTLFVAEFVGQTNLLPGRLSPRDPELVQTQVGPIPCRPGHGLAGGSGVIVSVRPESFELDPRGDLVGTIRGVVYSGNLAEVEVEVQGAAVATCLRIHVHPERRLLPGEPLRFSARPDFVALIPHSLPPTEGLTILA